MMMGDDEFDDLVQRLLRTAAGSSAAQQHGDSAGSGAGGGDSGGGYHHPEANRLYLQSSVLPLLREGLVALTAHVEQQRIRLASGVEWEEDGPYQPRGWRPFQPVRWLADWLDAHRPAGGGRDVPWEEMSREAKLGAVFDHLDADGSGALDLQELMLLVSRTPGQDVERAAGLMSQMDADQSGNVDMREYVAIMDALTAGLPDDQFDAMIKKMLSSRSYVSLSGREEKLAFIMQEAASAPGSRLDGASLTLGQLLAAARAFAPQLSDRDLLAAMGR